MVLPKSLRVGISGGPATGKKSVGRQLASMTGLEFVSLNEVMKRRGIGRMIKGEFIVSKSDLQKLRNLETRGKIVSGHLLPYAIPRGHLDFVAILRCSPCVLRGRYESRGYSREKSEQNIEAEILDIVSFKCLQTYGWRKVGEFDTTNYRDPNVAAMRIVDVLTGRTSAQYGIATWSLEASSSPDALKQALLGYSHQGKVAKNVEPRASRNRSRTA